MMYITYIVAGVVLLGLCIFVHELGHLLGGKMVGIKAKVFSMGYGKGVLKKKIGDTTYQVTLIPFGGYCQFYGENPTDEREGKEYEFLSAHPLKRIVTVIMGPLFNLFFGIIIFFVMNIVGYETESNKVYIPENFYKHPAYTSGIRNGDVLKKINDKEVTRFSDIQSSIFFSEGKEIKIKVERKGEEHIFDVIPEKGDNGRYSIGITPFIRNIIGNLAKGDVAEKAGFKPGDEILLVDGKKINYEDLMIYIRNNAGKKIVADIMRNNQRMSLPITPRENLYISIQEVKDKNKKAGFYRSSIEQLLKEESIKVNKSIITKYDDLLKVIKENKEKSILLEFGDYKADVLAEIEKAGFIGVGFKFSAEMNKVQYPVSQAFTRSFVEPYEFIVMNLKGMGMLFSGKLKVRENLSGPIRIVKLAGDVAHQKGLSAFILLMAQISIILMVMNLLPIPVVDGSHIIFYTIEAIRGKPLNEKIMEKIQTVGIVILGMLFVFIIINDILMVFFKNFFN